MTIPDRLTIPTVVQISLPITTSNSTDDWNGVEQGTSEGDEFADETGENKCVDDTCKWDVTLDVMYRIRREKFCSMSCNRSNFSSSLHSSSNLSTMHSIRLARRLG